jgi:tRNA-dihydrouridine synthase A
MNNLATHLEGLPCGDRRISVAPMMDWTDRHCRYFLRGFSPHTLLYTEMITAAAILRGDRARLLAFEPEEQPVALQLGGSNPRDLADAAFAGEQAGYGEINLNCGCPSDRVVGGSFGACLMRAPRRVADCVAAMKMRVRIPVSVKMRIGIVVNDEPAAKAAVGQFTAEDFARLSDFVSAIRDAGCDLAIVHARKAVLGGLSPKENREVPPLHYEVVRRLKASFPHLPIVVNGGFREVQAVLDALKWCDGVMLGREAYHRPFVLAELEHALHPLGSSAVSPESLLVRMARYAEREMAQGVPLHAITRHMLGLYSGQPGARDFRRRLSEGVRQPGAGPALIRDAQVSRASL